MIMGITTLRRRVALAAALMTVAAVAAPGAASAAGWSAPLLPIDLGSSPAPKIAMNARGDVAEAVAVSGTLEATVRPAGGSFSAPATLTTVGAGAPWIAINAGGDVAVAWATTNTVHFAVRPAGGSFGTPVDLATSAVGGTFEPVQAAITDSGEVLLVWAAQVAASVQDVRWATFAPGATTPSSTGNSGSQDVGASVDLAANGAGDAIVGWSQTDGTHFQAEAVTRTHGAAWGTPVPLTSSATADTSYLATAIAGDGRSVIAFEQDQNPSYTISAAYDSPGRLFTTPTKVTPGTTSGYYPDVALADDGTVGVTWSAPGSTTAARTGIFGTPFGAAVTTFGSGSSETTLAGSPNGRMLTIWNGTYSSAGWDVNVARRAPGGGAFAEDGVATNDVYVSATNTHDMAAAVDDAGDALVAYKPADAKPRLRFYDATGPELRSLSVPGNGTAGSALAFSVAPWDTFSAVGTPHWDFGDGAGADGASVSHAYGVAGTYRVTVSASDAAGNASSQSGSVTVAAAAVPGTAPVAAAVRPPAAVVVAARRVTVCKVPALKNLTPTAARAKLRSAHCALGRVTTPKKDKHKHGLVIRSQSRRAGTSTRAGATVAVTLGVKPKPRKPKSKHRK
jgi:hypothetical protein